ncbi:hypothetical protein [Nocardia carnea]|uniref:hypothetical protein n=1 Tax=Nocardia carnea TaxID=37328 RepID=UPI002454EEB5|nr:hypothetical protein [Nocardia carnea]
MDADFANAHTFSRPGGDLMLRVCPVVGGSEAGHVLIFGDPPNGCLVRVHSGCLFDDCLPRGNFSGPSELELALRLIEADGSGIVIYLRQEGRGAGVIAMSRDLLRQRHHGAPAGPESLVSASTDPRHYTHAAASLRALGLTAVRLITANPAKVDAMRRSGLEVTVTTIGSHQPADDGSTMTPAHAEVASDTAGQVAPQTNSSEPDRHGKVQTDR